MLCLAAMLVIPAAISWACGPNRAIQLDRHTYAPGQTVNVSGANFEPFATVHIKVNGGTVTSTTVSGTGNISASFSAPSSPGTYTVVTDGVDQNGQALAGTGNAVTLTVAAQSSSAGGGGGGGGGGGASSPGTSSPGAGAGAPAPGTTSGAGSRGGGDSSRSVTGGERLGRAPSSSAGGGGGGVNTTEGVIETPAGTTAFAGSVSRQDRVEAAEGAAARGSSANAGRPSERSAGADLWSGLTSRNNPSLVADDGAGTSDSGTGAGLAWALALLGAGVLGLIGLGAAEAQRRRRAIGR